MDLRKLAAYGRVFYHWKNGTLSPPYLPEDISIELTNTCNFKCAFCPQSNPEHFAKVARTTLSPADADVILGRIRKGGVKTDVIHWTLDGEPFINREIDRICELAIDHGFRVFIFATNGFYLSQDRLASLPTAGNAEYTLAVDFCADRDYFETYRGTTTSWERVRDNISRALEDESLEHIRFAITDISSFTVEDRDQLAERLQNLKALFPEGRVEYRSRVFHNMAGFLSGMIEKKQGRERRYNLCPYPWTSFVVASNGDVVACCRDLEHHTILGNLLEEEMHEIWNGKEFRRFRENLVNRAPGANSACNGCDLPYDAAKFSFGHIARRAIQRFGILK